MLRKVTYCTGHILVNARPHQLHWGDREMGLAISCTKCSRGRLGLRVHVLLLSCVYMYYCRLVIFVVKISLLVRWMMQIGVHGCTPPWNCQAIINSKVTWYEPVYDVRIHDVKVFFWRILYSFSHAQLPEPAMGCGKPWEQLPWRLSPFKTMGRAWYISSCV